MLTVKDKIEKLPKWAQEYIERLSRERDEARKVLSDFTDMITPSPFSFEHWVASETVGINASTMYVQTNQIRVEYEGVSLDILCSKDRGAIELRWGEPGNYGGVDHVNFQPSSYNTARLVNVFYKLNTDPWMKKSYDHWKERYEKTKKPKGDQPSNLTIWDGPEAPDFSRIRKPE